MRDVSHVRREVRAAAGLSIGLTAAVLATGALAAGLMGFSDWAPSWIGTARDARTVQLHPAQAIVAAAPAKHPAHPQASAPAVVAQARAVVTTPARAQRQATPAPRARKHARRGATQRQAVAPTSTPAVAPAQPVVAASVPAAKPAPRLRTASASQPVPVAHNKIHPVKPGKGPAKQPPGHAKPVKPGQARKPAAAAAPAPAALAIDAASPAAAPVHGPPPGRGREHAPGQIKKR